MDTQLQKKYNRLLEILSLYSKVAVAYSGGVDSTLMAYAACEALGPERVIILHATSCFLAAGTSSDARLLVEREISSNVEYRELTLSPLLLPQIKRNKQDRCYQCKKYIYEQLYHEISASGISVLLDGTNIDDLSEDRPGFRVIKELGVKTPYLEAGYHKDDIRNTAKFLRLSNCNAPSNSCLATRTERDVEITEHQLENIDSMERYLLDKGYQGCRVRINGKMIIIELRENDLTRLVSSSRKSEIITFFQQHGYDRIMVDLKARP